MSDKISAKPKTYSSKTIGRRFGDLKIRPKLIVLHNLFFLVLTCAVYFAVIPSFERRVASAKTIEVSLVTEIFDQDRPLLQLPAMEGYDYQEGSARKLQVPLEVKSWIDSHPGSTWQSLKENSHLFKKDFKSGLYDDVYKRVTLPSTAYDAVVHKAKVALFVSLGAVYILAVMLLEWVIMPLYVYDPLRLMRDADRATQEGDRAHELIDEALIPGDEIGQIMRSRNQTVAELRRQEDDLAQAVSRLEAQDRLASLGLLSASVAHEMNTPLAVLHGSVEKLIETIREPHTQDRLQRMLRVTNRLQKISEGLVDFARVRKEEFERLLLRALVQEAWSLVAIDEKAAEVTFMNEAVEGQSAYGNADRLIQVFVNLLRNALIAVDRGGQIMVRTRRCERDGRPMVALTVEDDGPGIPAEVLPDIFDAFVSSRLDSRGTGLGLTVAEGIVRQHGGTITASNRPQGGACLEVVLRGAL